MHVQTAQDLLLKPCPRRFLRRHQKPFAAVSNPVGKIRSRSTQINRNISCQVTTKLPASEVQHHTGALLVTSKASRGRLKSRSKLGDFLFWYSSDMEAIT